jgi:hypothetical protein
MIMFQPATAPRKRGERGHTHVVGRDTCKPLAGRPEEAKIPTPAARSDRRGECWLNPRARVCAGFVGSDLAFFPSRLWFSDPVANTTGRNVFSPRSDPRYLSVVLVDKELEFVLQMHLDAF